MVSYVTVFAIIMLLFFGTGTMVSSKMMLETETSDINGISSPFSKPFYQSLLMFCAMFVCLPLAGVGFLLKKCFNKTSKKKSLKVKSKSNPAALNFLLLACPAALDMLHTIIATIGLIYISLSIAQMLRGVIIVFAALIRVFFRKKKLHGYEWCGVLVCCAAVVLVGLASVLGGFEVIDEKNKLIKSNRPEFSINLEFFNSEILSNQDETVHPVVTVVKKGWAYSLLGCFLIIFGQFLCSIEITIDEFVLQESDSIPPLVAVGIQGLWGVLFCISFMSPLLYFLPGDDHGHYEDHGDTLYKIIHSKILIIISSVYFVCIVFFNYGCMALTKTTSAVLRSIYEMMRNLTIWLTQIFIHYAITSVYGEGISVWTTLEICGFILMVLSLFIYNGVIKIKCMFNYEKVEKENESEAGDKKRLLDVERDDDLKSDSTFLTIQE